jgi:lactoylglutathione lyase
MSQPVLPEARWTHVALPSGDLDKTIAFYTSLTPMVVVEEFSDADGRSVWLSNPKQSATPLVLVFVAFTKDNGGQLGVLQPFAHIGIEVPDRESVDAMAERARELDSLYWEPRDRGGQVGYICALKDPDGNIVEISHNQRVFESVRRLWGND